MKKALSTLATILMAHFCLAQPADEKVLMLISNTHLDTQWNWDVKTTIDQYVKNTLYDNIKLMDKYPNYVLNYESASKYRWMKEYYPSEYAKLQTYIDRGQWHPSGMSVDANDVMVSSAENILRNWLYGHMFFKREFGVRGGYDIMLPDCFGFGYTLPSLAHHAGFLGFHSQKLSWGSAEYDRLPRYGRWQGVDGSIIYAIHKPHAYDAHEEFNCDLTENSEAIKRINENKSNLGIPMDVRYVGPRGDRGGAMQDDPNKDGENTPYWLNYSVGKKNGTVNVILATPDSIFRYLASHGGEKLPVWNGELPMKAHGVGSYSSKSMLKRWNRSNELTADAAEKASSLAQWLGIRPYPQEALSEAWFRTLWQNHHDGITGTSIPKADEYSVNEYYLANKAFAQELSTSIGAVAQHLDTQVEGTPIVVYNPLSWERTDVVEGSMAVDRKPEGLCVYGPDGDEVLSQITGYDRSSRTLRFIFAATVPSLGYAVYDVRTDHASTLTSDLAVNVANRQISNGLFRVGLTASGDITSLYDLSNSRTILSNTKTQFMADHEDVWPAWEISYTDICRTPSNITGTADIQLAEDGPLRKSFRVQRQKNGSTFIHYIRMNALTNRVDCENEVDWQTHETLAKVCFNFPSALANTTSTFDLSLGTIERGIRSSDLYEVLGHQWADQTTTKGTYGVSILNDCKYGWDKPANNQLRLTLHHTPLCGGYKHQADMDIGPHKYTYSLFPHEGSWGAATQREASQLNQPLIGMIATKHNGALGRTLSFATTDTDEISIKALKKAEETDELIVRVFEWAGKDKDEVRITFPAEILSARETNSLEESLSLAGGEGGGLHISGQSLIFPIGHYQPKTFAVRLKGKEVKRAEQTDDTFIELAHNVDLMSYDSSIGNGLTTYTYLYPAELIPDTLLADGISFVMGNRAASKYNALRCATSKIVPVAHKPGQNRLHLLWASVDPKGTTATITIGDKSYEVYVPYFSGKVGEPLSSTNLEAHYTTQNVALTATHAHHVTDKKNVAMQEMYMYREAFDLPDDISEIAISGSSKVMLFAATATDKHMDDVVPFTPLTVEVDYDELKGLSAIDGRLKPSSVKGSHQISTAEAASKANDGDLTTKWCVGDGQSKTPYLEYTFKERVIIDHWMVMGAACESSDYIAQAFRVQYYDDNGEWKDIEHITGNQSNKLLHGIAVPVTTTKVRLQIEQGAQGDSYTTRIYEFAVYGMTESEATALPTPQATEDEDESDSPAVFYTIDGIQHTSLQPGINIIRRGGKTIKVLN